MAPGRFGNNRAATLKVTMVCSRFGGRGRERRGNQERLFTFGGLRGYRPDSLSERLKALFKFQGRWERKKTTNSRETATFGRKMGTRGCRTVTRGREVVSRGRRTVNRGREVVSRERRTGTCGREMLTHGMKRCRRRRNKTGNHPLTRRSLDRGIARRLGNFSRLSRMRGQSKISEGKRST